MKALDPTHKYRCMHCGLVFQGKDGTSSGVAGEAIDACPNYIRCGGAGLKVDVWDLGEKDQADFVNEACKGFPEDGGRFRWFGGV